MKWIAILLAMWGLANAATAQAAPAPNLVVNGDFETGNLNGWTAGGATWISSAPSPVLSGSNSAGISTRSVTFGLGVVGGPPPTTAFLTGDLSQVIPTTPGTTYSFKFSGSNTAALDGRFLVISGSITALEGDLFYGSVPSVLSSGQINSTNMCAFTANGPSVTVSFFRENPNNSDAVTIDNVSLQVAGNFSHHGKYFVKIKETQSFEGVDLSSTYTIIGVARIDSAGQIFYLGRDLPMQTGTISDDGTVNFGGIITTATINNRGIHFSGTTQLNPIGPVASTGKCTTEVTFTRTGN
jgi:hypothetical protein